MVVLTILYIQHYSVDSIHLHRFDFHHKNGLILSFSVVSHFQFRYIPIHKHHRQRYIFVFDYKVYLSHKQSSLWMTFPFEVYSVRYNLKNKSFSVSGEISDITDGPWYVWYDDNRNRYIFKKQKSIFRQSILPPFNVTPRDDVATKWVYV